MVTPGIRSNSKFGREASEFQLLLFFRDGTKSPITAHRQGGNGVGRVSREESTSSLCG